MNLLIKKEMCYTLTIVGGDMKRVLKILIVGHMKRYMFLKRLMDSKQFLISLFPTMIILKCFRLFNGSFQSCSLSHLISVNRSVLASYWHLFLCHPRRTPNVAPRTAEL